MYPAYQYDNLDYDNAIKKQEIALLEKKYCNTQEMQLNMASAEQMASSGQLQRLLVFNYGCMEELKLGLSQAINVGHHIKLEPGPSAYNRSTRPLSHQVNQQTQEMLDVARRIMSIYDKLVSTAGSLNSLSQNFTSYINQLPQSEVIQIQTIVQKSLALFGSIQDVEYSKGYDALYSDHDLKSNAMEIRKKNDQVKVSIMRLYPYLMDAISKYSPMVTNVRAGTVNSLKQGSLPQVNSNSYTLDRGHVAGH